MPGAETRIPPGTPGRPRRLRTPRCSRPHAQRAQALCHSQHPLQPAPVRRRQCRRGACPRLVPAQPHSPTLPGFLEGRAALDLPALGAGHRFHHRGSVFVCPGETFIRVSIKNQQKDLWATWTAKRAGPKLAQCFKESLLLRKTTLSAASRKGYPENFQTS